MEFFKFNIFRQISIPILKIIVFFFFGFWGKNNIFFILLNSFKTLIKKLHGHRLIVVDRCVEILVI